MFKVFWTLLVVCQQVVLADHINYGNRNVGFLAAPDDAAVRGNFHRAVTAALGAGHGLSRGKFGAVHDQLLSAWGSVAKNEHGRIDARTLRHLAHRYLMKMRRISIRGLDPLHHGESSAGVSLFTMHAPLFVQNALNENVAVDGFSLDDVVAMIAILEELVIRAGYDRLDTLFAEKGWMNDVIESDALLQNSLQTYLVRLILGNDTETIRLLESDASRLHNVFEDWRGVVGFIRGSIVRFQRTRAVRSLNDSCFATNLASSWHPFRPKFSFADVHALAGDIALTLGRFWDGECERVKASLVKMDYASTGRVKLSDFHYAAARGEWRFSESREYLRKLGALDESSDILAPQVIIPNYMQSASNCIVGDDHYRVCCADSCENYISEIEAEVQSPIATVEQLLDVVDQMTLTLDDDKVRVPSILRSQLKDIATTHQGIVPIHGRLFAQWLHYVFPRDCPFPHKAGVVSSVTALEFGERSMLTKDELSSHAYQSFSDNDQAQRIAQDGEEFMALWSEEEDLVSSSLRLQAPWEPSFLTVSVRAVGGGVLALLVMVLAMVLKTASASGGKSCARGGTNISPITIRSSKTHYV
eukprot:TRINITY_DN22383_c0_g1_i1.p1 TRINITY_DN22383_c0_g1~~TRINITY_DN22383_c0_g1_i1.p1  ORF type:complete len:622 (-),score=79.08 TRINITY_DN22383_c0_g1_i1:247-2007(-)